MTHIPVKITKCNAVTGMAVHAMPHHIKTVNGEWDSDMPTIPQCHAHTLTAHGMTNVTDSPQAWCHACLQPCCLLALPGAGHAQCHTNNASSAMIAHDTTQQTYSRQATPHWAGASSCSSSRLTSNGAGACAQSRSMGTNPPDKQHQYQHHSIDCNAAMPRTKHQAGSAPGRGDKKGTTAVTA